MTTAWAEPGVYTRKQRGTTVHIFAILPQFRITAFISILVQLHGVFSFQNKHMSGNLWLLMRKCSDIIFKWEWKKLSEVLYFHAKLWDAARKWGANTEHHGNVVFVWAYKRKCTCFESIFCPSLPANSQKMLNLPKRPLQKLQPFFVDVTMIVLRQQFVFSNYQTKYLCVLKI